ncbi:multidrug effflux MFS transporter [Cognatishimia sp. SS12]|uniref:multidrug effflux MFS transporter n=1 Tax=Cognatishimia sp. SS12 TaxID=2979465 RepID=UPI00232BA4D9|nr:multidrug effflux MFS transporter [Cognatishimia sp. SS12]MDC0738598.1 multidrug effflux MFS transporter [Cognatishimia sp. SS12]
MTQSLSTRYLDRTSPPHISTLILLAGVSAMSMNIFLPSLPGMAVHFQTDYRVIQLSVALYLGISAFLQILIGPISDKFGRRQVILWGIALFVLASLACVFAPTAEAFLLARMAQAIIAVAMVLSRAVVRDIYPTDQAASMIGYVTMGMSVVPMFGPTIGGVIEEFFGWKGNFWTLAGLGLLLFVITYRDLGETKVSSGLSLGAQFRQYPELLLSPRFWGYTLASAFASGAFFAYLGGAPFVGSELFGLPPAALGLYFGAPAIGYFAGNFLSGAFSARVGVNRMVFWGTVVNGGGLAVSLVVFELGLGSVLSFFGFMTLVGLGNGLVIPNATAGALSVRPHLAGTASGLSGAMMIGIGALLSAFAGFLLTPDTGVFPLLWLMLATSLLGILSIVIVILRERQIEG